MANSFSEEFEAIYSFLQAVQAADSSVWVAIHNSMDNGLEVKDLQDRLMAVHCELFDINMDILEMFRKLAKKY